MTTIETKLLLALIADIRALRRRAQPTGSERYANFLTLRAGTKAARAGYIKLDIARWIGQRKFEQCDRMRAHRALDRLAKRGLIQKTVVDGATRASMLFVTRAGFKRAKELTTLATNNAAE